MHPYQVDEEIRQKVYFFSTIAAILSAYLFSLLIKRFSLSVPWWIETPSVLGFYGFYILVYDNYLWKAWPFKNLIWFRTPNLNGTWTVEIKTSYDKFANLVEGKAVIKQTASKICVSLKTNHSTSVSTSAILTKAEHLNSYELVYHYVNKPNADSIETMSIHHGTTWLQISENKKCLEGDYYSGRGRQQFGSMIFKRRK